MKKLINQFAIVGAIGLAFSHFNALSADIALKRVNLVDVETLKVVPEQTVIIGNGKIKHILESDKAVPSSDIISIDMTGKYLIPGLIDSHVHHATDPDGFDNQQDTLQRLRTLLRGGVTGVRDMGGDTRALVRLSRDAMLDQIQSPDIFYSIIIGGHEFFADPRTISSAKGYAAGSTPWMAAVDDQTNLDHVMLKAVGLGATGIKVYADIDKSLLPSIVAAAKRHGLKVWSHVYIGTVKPLEAIEAGVETLSHAPDFAGQIIEDYKKWRRQNQAPDQKQEAASFKSTSYDNIWASMKESGAILDATMTVFESRKSLNENTDKRYKHTKMLTRLAHKNGITISAGTDAFSDTEVQLYKELRLLVDDGGLSPIEAIQAATINNAKVIGKEDLVGSITKGKQANLVVLSEDPTKDIEHIASIAHVIKNGHFIYLGADNRLPFIPAKKVGDTLWMSGQLGNIPSTMALASPTIEGQMAQTMKNIGYVLQEHNLTFDNITKCTLMLADIDDWQQASKVYKSFFTKELPTRSAFATSGLALGAKVEVECLATY